MILHDAYVEGRLMKEDENHLRVTKYHALPTTAIIICKYNEKVVATVSIIAEQELPLPLESLWKINHFKSTHRVCEISSLAIEKSFRKKSGQILIPLTSYSIHYARSFMGVDRLVISVHPFAVPFYRALFYFEYISKEVKSYDFVGSAPAVGMTLSLVDAKENWSQSDESFKRFIYHYYFLKIVKGCVYPQNKVQANLTKVMSPELFDYFFNMKSTILRMLTPEEKKYLAKIYHHDHYLDLIGESKKVDPLQQRFTIHFPVSLYCKGLEDPVDLKVIYASLDELTAYLPDDEGFRLDVQSITLIVEAIKDRPFEVSCRLKSIQGHKLIFEIISNYEWITLIDLIDRDYNNSYQRVAI